MAVLVRCEPTGSITIAVPGEKSVKLSTSGETKKQPALQRDELAERHEVDLAVDRGGLAVGRDQERRVVDRSGVPDVDLLIAAEENRHPHLARQRAKRRLARRILVRT